MEVVYFIGDDVLLVSGLRSANSTGSEELPGENTWQLGAPGEYTPKVKYHYRLFQQRSRTEPIKDSIAGTG